MHTSITRGLAKPAALVATLFGLGAGSASAQTIYALANNNQMIVTDAAHVCTHPNPVCISGIAAGQAMVGIDCRPSNGQLYGLGYNRTTGAANLYTIAATSTSSAATVVGAPLQLQLGTPGCGLSALFQSVGVDFNPVSGELRVISEATGKNYRINPTTAALVATDGNMFFPNQHCAAPKISAIAHSNSYAGATSTLLGAVDGLNNRVGNIDPPATGQFNSFCPPRGFPCAISITDFDIYYNPTASSNTIYLTRNNIFWTELMSCDLSLAGLSSKGYFRFGVCVNDIAVGITPPIIITPPPPPPTPTPVARGRVVYALTANGATLVSFNSADPATILSSVALSGVARSQVIVGMDINPNTGELYIMGFNPGGGVGSTYNVNIATGVCTRYNTASFQIDMGSGRNVGFDYNPTTDRIRAVSTNDNNYRLNPFTGLVDSIDARLNFDPTGGRAGDNPSVGSVAHTNKRAGATNTVIYAFDDSSSCFLRLADPKMGILANVGWAGYYFDTPDGGVDIDIYTDSMGINYAYGSGQVHGEAFTRFFNINLTTGRFTSVGTIGDGSVKYREIAITPDRRANGTIAKTALQPKPRAVPFPNPATGQDRVSVNFHNLNAGTYTVVLTDAFGNRVQSADHTIGALSTDNALSLNIAALHPGVYNVLVLDGGKVVAQSKLAK